ncbi:MAG: autotransporter-associated beta strand repeat-containing protein, partial [Verrucomicrobiota bacterium]
NLGVGGSWNVPENWNPASIPNAIGANATFNNAASGSNPDQTATRAITVDAAQTVGSININNDGANAFNNSITVGTAGSITFDETGVGPATITVNGIPGSTGNTALSAPSVLTDSIILTVNNTNATSGAGAITMTGLMTGSGGITRRGDGLSTIAAPRKNYTGPTILEGGRLRLSVSGSSTNTSSFTVKAGAQLEIITAGTCNFGSSDLNLNGVGAITGPYAIFGGAIRNTTGIAVTITNLVVLQSDTLIHVQALGGTGGNPTPTGSTTISNAISGPGRLTLTAPNSNVDQGSLILNGANTYQGGTAVNGGILSLGGQAATLGTGNVTVDNAAAPSAIAKLVIQSGVANAIADTATLTLAGGTAGLADLGAGVDETIGGLVLGGVTQAPGTYGSTASSASIQNDTYFSGGGLVRVVTPVAQPTLTITLAAPNAILSWPTSATGFTLQELAAFPATPPPFGWTDVTTPVVVSGSSNTVTVPASSGNDFFRLKK